LKKNERNNREELDAKTLNCWCYIINFFVVKKEEEMFVHFDCIKAFI